MTFTGVKWDITSTFVILPQHHEHILNPSYNNIHINSRMKTEHIRYIRPYYFLKSKNCVAIMLTQ